MTIANATVLSRFANPAGDRRLAIVQRSDGSFSYVEELRELLIEAEDGYPAEEIWVTEQASGRFSTLDDAQKEAFALTDWLKPRPDSGGK